MIGPQYAESDRTRPADWTNLNACEPKPTWNRRYFEAVKVGAAAVIFLIGLSTAYAAEKPIAAEHNPPGDIPDTQAFVTYDSPEGFTIKVPEGWARSAGYGFVRFADKYNMIEITVSPLTTAPTSASVKASQVPQIESAGRAVKLGKIKEVKVTSGAAILITYTSNSEPNQVTNKQVRLKHDRYLFYKDGKLASLDMSAPQGADNVDDWLLMANAFKWK
jgi:hypothetical protein